MRRVSRYAVVLVALFISFGLQLAGEEHRPELLTISVVKVSKATSNAVRLHLHISNQSSQPVLVEGANLEKPIVTSLFLQHVDAHGVWSNVTPCIDTLTGTLQVNAKSSLEIERVVANPIEGACKEQNVPSTGLFRFKLIYFLDKNQSRMFEEAFSKNLADVNHFPFVTSASFSLPL